MPVLSLPPVLQTKTLKRQQRSVVFQQNRPRAAGQCLGTVLRNRSVVATQSQVPPVTHRTRICASTPTHRGVGSRWKCVPEYTGKRSAVGGGLATCVGVVAHRRCGSRSPS